MSTSYHSQVHATARLRRAASLLLLSLLLFACRDSRQISAITTGAGDGESSAMQAENSSVQRDFDRLRRTFAHGATTLISPENVDVSRRAPVDRTFEAVAGECFSFIAVGETEEFDVDLVVTRPDGSVAVADRAPDHFPVISSWCAAAGGRFNLRLRARRGQGRALLGAYRIEADAGALLALRDRYFAGAAPLGPVNRHFLPSERDVRVPVALSAGRCYAVAAVGGEGTEDLDMYVFDPQGTEVTREIGTDATPVITRLCADATSVWSLRFNMYAGSGHFTWQLFEYPARSTP